MVFLRDYFRPLIKQTDADFGPDLLGVAHKAQWCCCAFALVDDNTLATNVE